MAGFFLLPDRAARNGVELTLGVSIAEAQKRKRRSLFSVIFGNKRANRKAVRGNVKVRRRKRLRKSRRARNRARSRLASRRSKRRRGVSRAALTPKVEKIDSAKVVLVVGDFLAGGLADGLQVLLADSAGLRVVDASNGLSGLVRADVVNWPQRIDQLAAEIKPAYVVAMVGANDRQLIRENGRNLKKRTPGWDASYKRRINEFGEALKATGLPYSWVGLPPMRIKSLSKDFLIFNEWYGATAKAPQGKFVDVWDGFSDEDGNYSRSGPDVSGQIVLLRPKDGINLTKAGRRRLAFYVEAHIRKAVNDPSGLFAAGVNGSFSIENPTTKADEYDPEKTGRTIVVNLNDPVVDGVNGLAGETVDLSANVLAKVKRGDAPEVVQPEGKLPQQRADNFSWPPKSYVSVPQPASVATASQ
ncbi:MAG: SGNH/GDSL hydrolase family protein [Rhizobiaceae bacterium]